MGVVIYQSLIIYIFILFYGVYSISVELRRNETGLIGDNGIEIECSYTQENIRSIASVSFAAFNRSTIKFEVITVYPSSTNSYLTANGKYLNGRVTLMGINQTTTKAVMILNKLMCIDDTLYRCTVDYFDDNGPADITSNTMSISVEVPPSIPDNISLVHTSADSPVNTPNHIDYTSSSTFTAVTSKENETVSASHTEIPNTTTAVNHSTIQTTGYNTTTTPSNISYRTTEYSSQQTTTFLSIVEGDNITVVCTGDVGKPPAKHVFQKYRGGQIVPMKDTFTTTFISEMSENCSYYRTSNIIFQVTADDNNAVIRCVVNSSITDSDLFIDMDPLEVYYKASMPTIMIYPTKTYYVEGEDTSINLTCKSDGNPKPYYRWYKENHTESISTSANFTIMDVNATNSGVYTCKVNNSFNGDTYRNAKHVRIDIMNKAFTTRITLKHSSTLADISTTKSSSIGSSSGVDKEEEKPEGNLGLVIGIVVAVVTVIVVIIVIIACRRRKSKSPTSKNVSNSFDDSKPKPVTETRTGDYDYIALEDDAIKRKSSNNGLEVEDIIKHNEEYLKKQEEEEKKKNGSNTPPQPAVYAQVNEATKLKNKPNTDSTENTDKKEEDPYAESQEDVYDKAGNSRHKENENVEHFDSLSSSKQNSNGDNKHSIQTSQVGSYANQGFEKDENRKVATVSPTVRSSTGSQNDEQTNSNRNSQSKKGYENIIGTDQTGISVEESSHRTAL